MIKKLSLFCGSLFMMVLLASCSAQPKTISFEQSSYTLKVGQTVTLSPQFTFDTSSATQNENTSITYASEDISVATVTKEGVVTAVGVGTTEIKAAVNDITSSVQIIVE